MAQDDAFGRLTNGDYGGDNRGERTAGVEAALADDKFAAGLKESVETIEDLNRH